MTLPQLKQDLTDRWLSAYDELKDMASSPVRTVYAPNTRFEINDLFIEQRSLSTEREPGYDFSYGLDKLNRPCYFERQREGEVRRKGYYIYTDSLTEYIEYNLKTGAPHCIQRITYNGNEKISFQSMTINRMAEGSTKEEILNNLLDDEYALYSAFELYHYSDGRISSADCLYLSLGTGEYTLQKAYKYNEAGELTEILDTYADGKVLYSYVRTPDDMTIEELSDEVASQIAADIRNTVEPITGILAIDFMEIGAFRPLLSIYPETQSRNIEELQAADPEEIPLKGSFDRLLCAFMREVDTLEDHDLAVEMTQQTARILNKSQQDYLAYSKDWDVEEDEDLIGIFKACGWPEEETSKWITPSSNS